MGVPHWLTVTTPDTRSLEVLVEGPSDGFPLVYHSGTPSGAVEFAYLSQAAAASGLRTVTFSRPGYGESTPQPGRTVADVCGDVSAVLAALGLEQFVAFGWSGGGPHALACAALMGDSCRGAATLAGVAPYPAPGLAWLDGMGAENVAEFGAALAGADALTAFLSRASEGFADVADGGVATGLGDLLSDVDRRAITGELASYLAGSLRRSVLHGFGGWRDDDLAFVLPWGFRLDTIAVPVSIWQGRLDRMVPFAHGEWLAANIPDAREQLFDDEGHLSLAAQLPRVFADLVSIAGLA
jgi:pimeloyl-ACP methyl ester carboxylesterase